MQDARAKKRIVAEIAMHLEKHPPVGSVDEVLHRFIESMRDIT